MKNRNLLPLVENRNQEASEEAQNEDFNLYCIIVKNITNEESVRCAFNYITEIIFKMLFLIKVLGDLNNEKSLFVEAVDPENREFNNIINNIKDYGIEVKRVCNLIYEYLSKEIIPNSNNVNYISKNTLKFVNTNTHLAQTVVKDYDGELSIEFPCLTYDLTIDEFNKSINLLNQQRNLELPHAEKSYLVSIYHGEVKLIGLTNTNKEKS